MAFSLTFIFTWASSPTVKFFFSRFFVWVLVLLLLLFAFFLYAFSMTSSPFFAVGSIFLLLFLETLLRSPPGDVFLCPRSFFLYSCQWFKPRLLSIFFCCFFFMGFRLIIMRVRFRVSDFGLVVKIKIIRAKSEQASCAEMVIGSSVFLLVWFSS